MLCRSHG